MDRPTLPPSGQTPLSDDEIHALVDAALAPEARAPLLQRLEHDAAAQTKLKDWSAQRQALQSLHTKVLQEAVPPALSLAARPHAVQNLNPWWRWGGMAASLVLTFGLGWLTHDAVTTVSSVRATQDFVRQASYAHRVYAPEVRHAVEVNAAEQAHLVQWLSKRVGKPLKVPSLSALGYELMGGRLLPGDSGARAQFMFQNSAGNRITLYLGALNKGSNIADARETIFQFANEGAVPSFFWVDQGFGYALAGPVERDVLLKLAELVYQQL